MPVDASSAPLVVTRAVDMPAAIIGAQTVARGRGMTMSLGDTKYVVTRQPVDLVGGGRADGTGGFY